MEVGREQRGLVSARAGADLDDAAAVVERVVREKRGADGSIEREQLGLEPLDLPARLLGELGVVNENELANLRELVLDLSEPCRQRDDRLKPAVLPSQLGEA